MTQRCGPTQSYRNLEREVGHLRKVTVAAAALRPHIETKLGGIVGAKIAALDAALREAAVAGLRCIHGVPFNDPCAECRLGEMVPTADQSGEYVLIETVREMKRLFDELMRKAEREAVFLPGDLLEPFDGGPKVRPHSIPGWFQVWSGSLCIALLSDEDVEPMRRGASPNLKGGT